uniref:Uncharacterized protein n=1 Tax=Oryza nivara TaxID=4536 RepID=A0A0E0GLL9_ORYNI
MAMAVGTESVEGAKAAAVVPCRLVAAMARCPAVTAAVSPRSVPLGQIWRVAGGSWQRRRR